MNWLHLGEVAVHSDGKEKKLNVTIPEARENVSHDKWEGKANIRKFS